MGCYFYLPAPAGVQAFLPQASYNGAPAKGFAFCGERTSDEVKEAFPTGEGERCAVREDDTTTCASEISFNHGAPTVGFAYCGAIPFFQISMLATAFKSIPAVCPARYS